MKRKREYKGIREENGEGRERDEERREGSIRKTKAGGNRI
jgi:hypothetical protein